MAIIQAAPAARILTPLVILAPSFPLALYTVWGKSRVTVASTQNTVFTLVLLFIKIIILFSI